MTTIMLPENLDFEPHFETTPHSIDIKSKWVVDGNTGRALGLVGESFNTSSHRDFFTKAAERIYDTLPADKLVDAQVKWKSAYKGAWAMADINFPNMKEPVYTDDGWFHKSDVGYRVILWHAVNGMCSNNFVDGLIDFFCTNGMISGVYNHVKRKNTKAWNLKEFTTTLGNSADTFNTEIKDLRRLASSKLNDDQVSVFLEAVDMGERKQAKMFDLWREEATCRGENAFALTSAFTNYSSYADERNGFKMRNTGNDTQAVTMFNRELEVVGWRNKLDDYLVEIAA